MSISVHSLHTAGFRHCGFTERFRLSHSGQSSKDFQPHFGIGMMGKPAHPRWVCGLTLIFIGGLLLAALSSEYVRPYIYARDFETFSCTVEHSYFTGNVCCTQAACRLQHPCFQILVTTFSAGNDRTNRVTTAVLYEDYYTVAYQESYAGVANVSDPENIYSETSVLRPPMGLSIVVLLLR